MTTQRVSHPISLLDIIDAVSALQFPGRLEAVLFRILIPAPAGATTIVTLPVQRGWVIFHMQATLVSDFYSPLINGAYFIDGRNNTPLGFPGTAPLSVIRPSKEVVRDNMTIVVINNTVLPPVNINVTMDMHSYMVEQGLYDDIIEPMLRKSVLYTVETLLGPGVLGKK